MQQSEEESFTIYVGEEKIKASKIFIDNSLTLQDFMNMGDNSETRELLIGSSFEDLGYDADALKRAIEFYDLPCVDEFNPPERINKQFAQRIPELKQNKFYKIVWDLDCVVGVGKDESLDSVKDGMKQLINLYNVALKLKLQKLLKLINIRLAYELYFGRDNRDFESVIKKVLCRGQEDSKNPPDVPIDYKSPSAN